MTDPTIDIADNIRIIPYPDTCCVHFRSWETLIRPDGSSSVSDSPTSVVLGHFHEGYSDH